MDSSEASVGNTLYLPVNVPGALLYMGDGHAAMGDGEIAGTAIEVPLLVRLRVRVIKGQKIDWPRFENKDEIMAVGIYRRWTMPCASLSRNSPRRKSAWPKWSTRTTAGEGSRFPAVYCSRSVFS